MNKRLILLILALPLLLMLCLFTTANRVSITIQVPVTGIDVVLEGGNSIVYLNLDDQNNGAYHLDYVVYPIKATNKTVSVTFLPIEGEPFAQLSYDDSEQIITPLSVGKAQVVLQTQDGGFKKGFEIHVNSTSIQPLQSISCSTSKTELFVGDTVEISTTFFPLNVNNKTLEYSVQDSTVASVSNQGVITALKSGTTTITITSRENKNIFDTITITVSNQHVIDLVKTRVETSLSQVLVLYSVTTTENYQTSFAVVDENENDASNIVSFEIQANGVLCVFEQPDFVGELTVTISITTPTQSFETIFELVRLEQELTAQWQDENPAMIFVGDTIDLFFNVTPKDTTLTFTVELSQPQVASVISIENGKLTINGVAQGNTTITITITDSQNNSVTLEKTLIVFSPFE